MPPGEEAGLAFDVDLRHIFGRYIVPQTIPYDDEVGKALLIGKAVVVANPAAPASVQYHTLAQWLGLAAIPESETVDIFASVAEAPPESKPEERPAEDDAIELFGSISAQPPLLEADEFATAAANRGPVSGVNLAAPPVAAESTEAPADPEDEDDSILAKDVPAADGKPSSESISAIWSTLPPPSKHSGPGHTGDITAVAFTPDGLGLVTSSWDKTVRLWELASGKELAVLAGHTGVVSGATFAPDGETF